MIVKKQKECSHAVYKMFLGILLIIASIIFWFSTDLKDALMYTFFVTGILFLLKGIYLSSK
jgi:uncharacterized membrane protein HdeD (DUF308 family)